MSAQFSNDFYSDAPEPRMPPHAIDAERAVIGALMLAPAAIAKIADWLGEADFFRRDHQMIYRAISDLAGSGAPCDAVTLGDWFDNSGLGDLVGGPSYLVELSNNTPSAANIVGYAEIVLEKARLRRAIEAGTALASAACERGAESSLVVTEAMHTLSQMQSTQQRGGLKAAKPMLQSWFADLSQRYSRGDVVIGLPTPWPELNKITHGLQAGELVVIAARPNMGKSVMGGQIAYHCAINGIRTAVFSLEMTEQQVMRRAVAALGGISHDWLMAPDQDESPWPRVTNAMQQLVEAPLLVDDTPALSIEQLQARARRAHLQAPIGLLVVDHLHEMKVDPRHEASDIGRNAQGLKALGKEFGCPVVALAQLNRSVAGRTDKRPTMTDLRSSGEIEQKADVIIFLHREDYYDPNTHLKGIVEAEIGKGRDVKTGAKVYLANRYDQMRLDDYNDFLPADPAAETKRHGGFRRGGN